MIARALGSSVRPKRGFICPSCLCLYVPNLGSRIGSRFKASSATSHSQKSNSPASLDDAATALSESKVNQDASKKTLSTNDDDRRSNTAQRLGVKAGARGQGTKKTRSGKVKKATPKKRKSRRTLSKRSSSDRSNAKRKGNTKAVAQAKRRTESNAGGKTSVESFPSFEKVLNHKLLKDISWPKKGVKSGSNSNVSEITDDDLRIKVLNVEQNPVPSLSYGLDRVLFNPGVYYLQDPRSRIYNFDPYLEKIMPVTEFDFDALKEYMTSSRDDVLSTLAKQQSLKYVGSTSSMTGVLSHFHYLISQQRELNLRMLSKGFPETSKTFTRLQRGPVAIFLRCKKDGVYAIDSDHAFDSGNILLYLGKSMEKLLTLPKEEFERYRVSSPDPITEQEKLVPETYYYSSFGDILMRAQLDAHDPRLPGTGTFDLKTRAVISVRMEVDEHENAMGYQIRYAQGRWESFEREYYDMIRSNMLKYSLQVRMGNMDGIFVAYHNVERIFGFQYISLPEMDRAVHGQTNLRLGDQEFRFSLKLFNILLNKINERFPQQSVRIHFETRDSSVPFMYIFAESMSEDQIEKIQESRTAKLEEFERSVLGLKRPSPSSTEDWAGIRTKVEEQIRNDELSTEDDLVAENLLQHSALDQAKREPLAMTTDLLSSSEGIGEEAGQPKAVGSAAAKESSRLGPTDSGPNIDNQDLNSPRKLQQSQEQHTSPHINGPESRAAQNTATASTTQFNKDGNDLPQQPLEERFVTEFNSTSDPPQTTSQESDSAPNSYVLAMVLTIRNKVNGQYVQRPDELAHTDNWTLEYSISEITDPIRAARLYTACMQRRELFLNREDNSKEKTGYFHATIRELADRGRRWRQQQDIIDDKIGQIVYEPITPSSVPRHANAEGIKGEDSGSGKMVRRVRSG